MFKECCIKGILLTLTLFTKLIMVCYFIISILVDQHFFHKANELVLFFDFRYQLQFIQYILTVMNSLNFGNFSSTCRCKIHVLVTMVLKYKQLKD